MEIGKTTFSMLYLYDFVDFNKSLVTSNENYELAN